MSPTLRRLFVIVAALAAMWLALWSASDRLPGLAGRIPPQRAEARTAALMTQLGKASRSAGTDLGTLDEQARSVAAEAPLDPAPFLVAGGIAEQRGEDARAGALYRQALSRNPRSQAAHYMLARRALDAGRPEAALRHMAELARLSPGAGPEFAKLMLAVAAQDSNDAVLKRFLAKEPDERETLFGAMANDPQLAARILALAPPRRIAPIWLSSLTGTLVRQGRTDLAASAWARFGGGGDPRVGGVHDGQFALSSMPAPFGWTFDSSTVGTASRNAKGLDVEAYGREVGPLASQWMLLVPGRYRLLTASDGAGGALLEWRLQCVTGDQASLAVLPFGPVGTFAVPPGCAAQSIALWTKAAGPNADGTAHLHSVRLERIQ